MEHGTTRPLHPALLDAERQPPSQATSAIDRAVQDHIAGQWRAAQAQYRTILASEPDHAMALHFLGVLRHQQGHEDEGLAFVRKSLALEPQNADWHNALGNMLSAQGQAADAVMAFMSALEADASHVDAWNNLGALLLAQGALEDAITALRNAVELAPSFRQAHQNLGDAYRLAGNLSAAALCYCAEYVLRPVQDTQYDILGLAYRQLGRNEEAAQVYQAWLEQEPGHPIALHLLAASCGQVVDDRASPDYLQTYFDAYAETFEDKLVGNLGYRVPQIVHGMLSERNTPANSLRVMDLGCGTGLCGLQLRRFSSHLAGVDLSARSLTEAERKEVYDSLHQRDIVEHLVQCEASTWDLLTAADVLIYFGDLTSFLAAARRALAPGGRLLASFEEAEMQAMSPEKDPGYTLQSSGRYSHHRDYLLQALQTSGFRVDEAMPLDIRHELARPVKGVLLMATAI